jgi:hypothetical protein
MLLNDIYQKAVTLGIEKDPRGKETIEKLLAKEKAAYDKLKDEEKADYDTDKLTNPYSDTRILYGKGENEVKRILAGIDMEVGEVLLADRLREKGQAVDLILAHHPEGKALAALHDVMHMQEDIWHGFGVPINVAEGLMAPRVTEVQRGLMPINHNKTVDAARLLDIPMMCVHTPADNLVNEFLIKLVEEKNPETVEDIIKILKEIPEYKESAKFNAPPTVFAGSEKRKAGKIFIDMTGGTGGPDTTFEKLALAGVGTIVGMHINEKSRKEAEKYHLNVLIAGHISSDSLGMNLLLDEYEKTGVEVQVCSGILRHSRV